MPRWWTYIVAALLLILSSPGQPPAPANLAATAYPGFGAVTSRAIFSQQADGTWSSPASFPIPLPNLVATVQVFRNGLLQDEPNDYVLTYNQTNGGSLVVTPVGTWAADDTVRGIWVQ